MFPLFMCNVFLLCIESVFESASSRACVCVSYVRCREFSSFGHTYSIITMWAGVILLCVEETICGMLPSYYHEITSMNDLRV